MNLVYKCFDASDFKYVYCPVAAHLSYLLNSLYNIDTKNSYRLKHYTYCHFYITIMRLNGGGLAGREVGIQILNTDDTFIISGLISALAFYVQQ